MYRVRQISSRSETGSVLIVSLIMLLLLSLIGVAGIQTTIMQDRMAANLLDKGMAFEAAEAALREAEVGLSASVPVAFTGADGLYWAGANNRPDWPADPTNDGNSVITYSGSIPAVNAQPKYIIEQLEIPCKGFSLTSFCPPPYFRVTSVGFGGSDTSAAVLTTVYRIK